MQQKLSVISVVTLLVLAGVGVYAVAVHPSAPGPSTLSQLPAANIVHVSPAASGSTASITATATSSVSSTLTTTSSQSTNSTGSLLLTNPPPSSHGGDDGGDGGGSNGDD